MMTDDRRAERTFTRHPGGRRGGRDEPAGLRELRREVDTLWGAAAARPVRGPRPAGPSARSPGRSPGRSPARRRTVRRRAVRRRAVRRRRIVAIGGLAALLVALAQQGAFTGARSAGSSSRSALARLALRRRIVAIAGGQVGYRTSPADSYCNRFSAYWDAGSRSCPAGETAEEWCADFAAWAWRQAGVSFDYGYGPGELNAGAASFYLWGVAHGTWHPSTSGYTPAPGDVAIYGLSPGGQAPSAAHVAIVTGMRRGRRGPDVINGDGDRTGFSTVEIGHDQLRADGAGHPGALLSGYVSP